MSEADLFSNAEDKAKKELAFLAKRLQELDDAYYQNDAPLVTDAQYDALKRRNEELEAR